jgi:hypothetical protein
MDETRIPYTGLITTRDGNVPTWQKHVNGCHYPYIHISSSILTMSICTQSLPEDWWYPKREEIRDCTYTLKNEVGPTTVLPYCNRLNRNYWYWESEIMRVQHFNYFWWESEGRRIIFCESDTLLVFSSSFFYPRCREGKIREVKKEWLQGWKSGWRRRR